MEWKLLALVALASGLGGGMRYLLSGWTTIQHYPTGTLIVNAVGCFLIGLLVFGGISGGWLGPQTRLVVGIGLLGGFTTMSTFTYETVSMLDNGAQTLALGNIGATLIVCLGATWIGRLIGLALWTGGN